MRTLTRNEQRLSWLAGGLLLAIGSLLFFRWASGEIRKAQLEIAESSALISANRQILDDAEFWLARDQWVTSHPPETYAGRNSDSQFAEAVQKSVEASGLIMQAQQLQEPETADDLVTATFDLTIEGPLESLVRWLHALQQPGRYYSVQSLNVKKAEGGDRMILQARLRKTFGSTASVAP